MKRFFCVFLTLLILIGSTAVMASPATDTDLGHFEYPSTDTDIPPVDAATPDSESDGSEFSDWEKLIKEFLEANKIDPKTVSFAYYNTVTEEEHYFEGDKAMTAASVNKLPLNMYYAEKLYNGEISWDTTFKGVAYKLVQEYSLRYSNNEYTNALIDAIGDYPDYRKAILPYIGLEEDDVEFAYLTVNKFTAEEIMHCLKLLYADPDRYPGVMENMLLATPGEYFEQSTEKYEVAQKYGWYVQDGHNSINCVGIVETEDPILLAVFSDNCSMGKDILGEYCALMVAYTEETVAVRKEAEAAAAAEEALRAEQEKTELEEPETAPLPESTPAVSENTEGSNAADAENALRIVACVTACAVLAIAMGLVSRKKKAPADSGEEPGNIRNIISAILGAAAIVAIIATIVLCTRGIEAKPVIVDEGSDPAIVAEEFISLALDGKSAEAEELLLGSSTLGLDSKPVDTLGAMLYEALLESFSYEAKGSCIEDSIDANQTFTVTYLDLPSLTALQQEATNARLAQYVDEAQRAEEVLAEDGSYLPEVAMAALEEVTAELLADAESHYVQTELTIRLRYSGGEWKVIADEDLFAILSGNTAY